MGIGYHLHFSSKMNEFTRHHESLAPFKDVAAQSTTCMHKFYEPYEVLDHFYILIWGFVMIISLNIIDDVEMIT